MHVLDELLGLVLGQCLHALGLVLERKGAADESGVILGDFAAFQAVGQRGLHLEGLPGACQLHLEQAQGAFELA